MLGKRPKHRLRALWLGGWLLVAAAPLLAEELRLKNGEKIVGTIVGYEGDMFRVETEFGFALVRKDRVASIDFGAGSATKASAPKVVVPQTGAPAAKDTTGALAAPPPEAPGITPKQAAAPPVAAPVKAPPPPPPPPRPLDRPLPDQIIDRIEGTSYINETFRFAMYKPPGWRIYEGVGHETGRAIVAIGTEDEQTLLIVERQVWSAPPDLKSDATEGSLRRTYEDFRKHAESSAQVDGRPAVRRLFTGMMDGVEWHGVAVHVARDNTLFGIIGLTSEETHQFQQAVFNKIINSFRFLAGASEAAARR